MDSIFVVSDALAVASAWQCSLAVCSRSARAVAPELSVSCSTPRYLVGPVLGVIGCGIHPCVCMFMRGIGVSVVSVCFDCQSWSTRRSLSMEMSIPVIRQKAETMSALR